MSNTFIIIIKLKTIIEIKRPCPYLTSGDCNHEIIPKIKKIKIIEFFLLNIFLRLTFLKNNKLEKKLMILVLNSLKFLK